MPLKVSSLGWVKVAPPPKKPPPPKRPVDPEEEKAALCAPLRYFACQAVDPSRERLRMLGGRAGFSSSQVDLVRPLSRLERSSTLDEWRHDVQPSRSSSRQSGHIYNEEPGTASDHHSHRMRRREPPGVEPIVISASPTPSVYDEIDPHQKNGVGSKDYPDHVSVAYTETPSERHCRRHHRHGKSRKAPSAIPEEEEQQQQEESAQAISVSSPGSVVGDDVASEVTLPFDPTASELVRLREMLDEISSPVSIPAPPPSLARSDTCRSRRTEAAVPNVEETTTESVSSFDPEPYVKAVAEATEAKSEKSGRMRRSHRPEPSRRLDRSDRSEVSSYSDRSSRSSRSSRSTHSSYLRVSEDDAQTVSSYTASTRSASPIRSYRDKHYRSSRYDDEASTAYYPSPSSSPPPPMTRTRTSTRPSERDSIPKTYKDRVVTAPALTARPAPAMSASTWNSSSSSSSKSSTLSSRSSAPSTDGYQFQAAIFQPKSYYKGYRAPSLSKGNRWETATSALSFD